MSDRPSSSTGPDGAAEPRYDEEQMLTLTTGGITLLGVLLSIGVSVGFGINGPWWLRVAAGAATSVGLVLIVKVATKSGRGPLARLARWTIERSPDRP